MELKIKKRIIGFLLLLAIILIALPMFLGRSINSNELQLSNKVPQRPPKPAELEMEIPSEEATVANVPAAPVPQSTSSKLAPSRIVFEQIAPSTDNAAATTPKPNQPLFPTAPVASNGSSTSSSQSNASPSNGSQSQSSSSNTPEAPISLPSPEDAPQVSTTTPSPTPKPKDTTSKPDAKSSETQPNTASLSTPASTPATVSTPVKPTPQKVSTAKAEAWVVQMGSFAEKTNAETLMKKIQAAGYPAYLTTSQTAKGTAVRVFVGPELQKSTAEAMQAKLMQMLGINGIVVKAPKS